MAVSVIAWLLIEPVRNAAESDGSWYLALLESVLGIVFVAGLEGLFINMIPIRFMDGAKVMRWSRVGWALMFGTVTFLFWQLVINRDEAYVDAFKHTNVWVAVIALAFFMLTTGGAWTFFRLRTGAEEAEG